MFARFALTDSALVRESPGARIAARGNHGGRRTHAASHAMEDTMTDRKKLLEEVFEAALQYDMNYFG
jgi:hypothetical protein